jgi:hypothetical protein
MFLVILSYIVNIATAVCAIYVLVKLFQKEGALKGILGLICMLYTYIWGWMHLKDESLKLKNWMYAWTALIVLGVILYFVAQTVLRVQQDIINSLGG